MSSPYQSLFVQLDEHTKILTANQRLARHLNKAFIMWRMRQGHPSLITGEPIQSVTAYVDQYYEHLRHQGHDLPWALSPEQNQYLWQCAVTDDEQLNFQSHQSARLASDAYKLIKTWGVHVSELEEVYDNANTVQFLTWLKKFENIKGSEIVPEEKLNYLIHHRYYDVETRNVIYVGFDHIPAVLQSYLTLLQQQNVEVKPWCLEQLQVSKCKGFSYSSEQDELTGVAQQVKAYINEYPNAKVGVICPDLQSRWADISEIFDEIVEQGESKPYHQKNYAISGGYPLSTVPVVSDALAILNLAFASDYEVASQVLRSRYVRNAHEAYYRRAQLDLKVRGEVYQNVTLSQLIQFSQLPEMFHEYGIVLMQLERFYSSMQKTGLDWASGIDLIMTALSNAGWPGDGALSSEDYQAVERLYSLLDGLQSLQAVNDVVSFFDLVQSLSQHAQNTLFQPESNANAQIEILGVLEASQVVYDKVWLVGMDEHTWPSLTAPNSLIPKTVLRHYNMPHCSAEHEYHFAKQVTERLLQQAPEINISYVCWKDELSQSISPLFDSVDTIDVPAEKLESSPKPLLQKEDRLSPVSAEERLSLKGGSQLFQSIAQCPFQAAMRYRLGVEKYPEFRQPLDPMTKGILVHAILEKLWRELSDSDALQQLSQEAQQQLVSQTVSTAIQKYVRVLPKTYAYLIAIETERLELLMNRWLDYERERVEPFNVVACEQKIDIRVDEFVFSLRVDRVDQLASGGLVIIDYKTSKQLSVQSWVGQRVTEPQLPLYAVFYDADAIAYAQLNGDKTELLSLSSIPSWISDTLPKSITEHRTVKHFEAWSDLRSFWKQNVNDRLQEFISGDISLNVGAHCQRCDYQAICRVN